MTKSASPVAGSASTSPNGSDAAGTAPKFGPGRPVSSRFELPPGLSPDPDCSAANFSHAARMDGGSDDWDFEIDKEFAAAQRTRASRVRKGQVRKVFDEIVEETASASDSGPDWSLPRLRSDLQDLAATVRNRSRDDIEGLIDEVLAETASTLSLVVLRGHRVLHRRLVLQDEHATDAPSLWLPTDIRETLLPSLIEMGLQLAELQRLMAATKRQNELTERRRKENKKPSPRNASLRRQSATRTPRKVPTPKR